MTVHVWPQKLIGLGTGEMLCIAKLNLTMAKQRSNFYAATQCKDPVLMRHLNLVCKADGKSMV